MIFSFKNHWNFPEKKLNKAFLCPFKKVKPTATDRSKALLTALIACRVFASLTCSQSDTVPLTVLNVALWILLFSVRTAAPAIFHLWFKDAKLSIHPPTFRSYMDPSTHPKRNIVCYALKFLFYWTLFTLHFYFSLLTSLGLKKERSEGPITPLGLVHRISGFQFGFKRFQEFYAGLNTFQIRFQRITGFQGEQGFWEFQAGFQTFQVGFKDICTPDFRGSLPLKAKYGLNCPLFCILGTNEKIARELFQAVS